MTSQPRPGSSFLFMLVCLLLPGVLINSLRKQLHQFDKVTQRSHPPGCDVDVTQYTASLLECDNCSTLFGVLLNKLLYCMFPDPFLPRVAVRVGKGSGYARLLRALGTLKRQFLPRQISFPDSFSSLIKSSQ